MQKESKLTKGPIIKSLIALAIPIIFTNILQTAYQLIDTFWLGRLGSKAVAAVSISFPIIFLLVSFGSGLAIAGAIMVAHYKGRENKKALNHVAMQTMIVAIMVAAITTILGILLSPVIVGIMTDKQDVFVAALNYIRISFVGVVFMFSYMVFQSVMRGIGNVKLPMYIVLSTVILNLFLDPLFIFGYGIIPSFGIVGAAIATVATQALAAFVGLYILAKGKHGIKLNFSEMRPDVNLIKKICRIGWPASIEQSTRAFGMTFITFLVALFGTNVLAAFGIGARILSFIIIPAMGFSMATSTLVGQSMGARNIGRAEKIAKLSALLSFVLLSFVGILMFLFAKQIAEFFIPNEIETIKEAATFIRIISLTFGFVGIQMSLKGAIRGSGDTLIAMLLSIISLWFLRFPLAYYLAFQIKLASLGIWLAFASANIIAAAITFAWFVKGEWKKKKIVEEKLLIAETAEETVAMEGE